VKLSRSAAEVFVPDGAAEDLALARVTHLGIGAHQDDLEFMAFQGITECLGRDDRWFGGVTCTDGAGSARSGDYAESGDAEMAKLRRAEQRAAAMAGGYGVMLQLGYKSTEVKDPADSGLREDLRGILEATQPEVVYTHNLADKHPTHIAVALAVIAAVRSLPRRVRPQRVIGCEVWRDLDWLRDDEKVVMDVSGHDALAAKLAGCFASQIGGGKRYDLAVEGRRAANATFLDPRATDGATRVIFGMDLTPLVEDDALDPGEYVEGMIERFRVEVSECIGRSHSRVRETAEGK
jgi:LmbE family N-acetylglucosaminyl deacetylase